ncbi:unnamed protein product [Orchesella dallaii]|uniref:Uncharacterized protein n=1 Tax=Orchesella dallaii TaxID=48710 RepID=A0ABP1PJC0_9HEXA
MPPPSQPSERPVPIKKSLRLWVKNNGHVIRKKRRFTYSYPRTVEAAKDPFECATGKNKMFYLIAINLYPDKKIIRPDNSDSETEVEETNQNGSESHPPAFKVDSQQVRKRKRKVVRKATKKLDKSKSDLDALPLPLVANSLKLHNPEINHDLCGTFENVKAVESESHSVPKGKTPRARKRSTPNKSKKTGIINVTNNENETECSRLPLLEEDTSLSKSKENSNKNDELVKANNWLNSRKKSTAVPNIVNSFNKIVQTCSETGVVSFSLSKKPRQSRS